MTDEELHNLEKLAEARLRVGDALAAPMLQVIAALWGAWAENAGIIEIRQRGCDCSDEDACILFRQREDARAEITRLRRLLGEIP